jgi:poly(hydroxyalkanoate) granule-associated protein
MVKKLKAMADRKAAGPAGLLDNALAQSIKDSAQQIWLAGMGAFAKAQAEGTQAFEKLIKDGISLQKKTQGMAEEKISEVTGKMTAMAGEVTAKAGQHWDKLESIFEQRTAKAMTRLGVPTAKDLAALNERLDRLAADVAKLGARKTPAKKAAPRKAAKKTPPKSAAA